MTAKVITQLLSARTEEFCQRYLPNGKKEGHEWLVGDVMGSPGRSLGVQLDGDRRGLWNDRASDDGGTLLDLLKSQFAGDFPRASDEARRFLGLPAFKPSTNGHPPEFDPLKKPFKRNGASTALLPIAAWPYHDASGHVFAYACRFQMPNGSKDVIPMRQIDGEWRWKGWTGDEKRPIYNLHLLKQRPEAPVLIVEGEKKADAGRKLFPDVVPIAWQGGCKAVSRVDWEPIASRRTPIVLWPDADDPGRQAMLYLKARFPNSHIIQLPAGLPDGWDIADTPPPDLSLRGILDGALHPPPESPPPEEPFRLLGFDESVYFYGCHASGLVTHLEATQHVELQLQRIAPDDFWVQNYPPAKNTNRPDYGAAAKELIARQHTVGFFNPDVVRGLGCWIDAGRIVYHGGDRLLIDGIETPLSRYRGDFLYPRRRAAPLLNLADALSSDDCRSFLELCQTLRWTKPDYYWVLPGWMMCAIVGGVLAWRPHIWMHGEAGSGKSWSIENLITRPILNAVRPLSSTTEAGIRLQLQRDALAVIFDELEPRDERANARIAAIVELVRQSSSDSSGSIYKGTQSGGVVQYRVRSCFCFSSIAPAIREAADESRITKIELCKGSSADFERVQAIWRSCLEDDKYCRRLMARAVRMARAIQQGSVTFQRAIARAAGDARTGQQYGSLAAGYWALVSDSAPTDEEAATWANAFQWDTVRSSVQTGDDPERCLESILQSKIQFEHDGIRESLSIGELLQLWFEKPAAHPLVKHAYLTLVRHGIHPIGQNFDIADRFVELQRLLKETPYKVGWKDHLLRLPGAKPSVYTPPGGKTLRSVRVPRYTVEGLGQTSEQDDETYEPSTHQSDLPIADPHDG